VAQSQLYAMNCDPHRPGVADERDTGEKRPIDRRAALAAAERPSNNALQLTSGGPLTRALRSPSSMRRSQLNAVLDRH
jgi:hypothetical protein